MLDYKKIWKNIVDWFYYIEKRLFKTEHNHRWFFLIMKKRFFSLPISVRLISLSSFIFIFWWWFWWDTFFSVYIKSIVDNIFLVSVVWMIYPFVRMLFAIPIWDLNNDVNKKHVILLSKVIYVLCSVFFFLAWMFLSPILLLLAVFFNGIASATLFVTYESYIRSESDKNHSENSWWLYFSSVNAALAIWAIISSFLIIFIDLYFLYLFVALFSILSLYTDNRIRSCKKDWNLKKIIFKESFISTFLKRVFSIKPIKKSIIFLKKSPKSFVNSLWYEWLFNILLYISYLFIPLVALKNHFSLSQIALIVALMKLPYVSNFLISSLDEKFNKKQFIIIMLIFLSFMFATLWFDISFGAIMIVSFGISIWLSIIRPIISWLISEYSHDDDVWSITGVQQFVAGLWMMLWSIWFWFLSSFLGISITFFVVWLSLFVLSVWGLIKFHKKVLYKK